MSGGAGGDRELRRRVLSALVLVPVAVTGTVAGEGWFALLAVAFMAVGLWEWLDITAPGSDGRALPLMVVLFGLVAVVLLLAGPAPALLAAPFALAVAYVVTVNAGLGLWPLAGLAYALAALLAVTLLREGPHGLVAVLFLCVAVWASDIGAYFAGRAIGGPKLAPRISPKKTWSGAVGGALAAVGAGLLVAAAFAGGRGLAPAGALAFGLSVAAQAGDLFESALKRRFGVKDSGRIIPGHGGVLDRIDGLAAAAVLMALVGLALGGLHRPASAFF